MSVAAGSATTPPAEPTPPHEHAWALMQFELVDDHPVVRQLCDGCGLVRRYRAWERYWDPGVVPARVPSPPTVR